MLPKRLCCFPSASDSASDNLRVESVRSRSLGNGREASERRELRAAVVSLLRIGCPPAIARRVVAVVVDAIQRVVAVGARPHVGVERLKGRAPSFTNLYASSAIARELPHVWVEAPPLHSGPYSILRCLGLPVRLVSSTLFRAKAAARQYRASAKVRTAHGFLLPAVTQTQPHGRLTAIPPNCARSLLNYGVSTKSLPNQVASSIAHFSNDSTGWRPNFTAAWQRVTDMENAA